MAWLCWGSIVAAFIVGWLTGNLVHVLMDRKLFGGLLDTAAALAVRLLPNPYDLELAVRALRVLKDHAARERPGWCPPAREELRELVGRLEALHGAAPGASR